MARLHVADVGAIDATRIGSPLRGGLLVRDAEAALLVAPIVGEGIALGEFQRAPSTIDLPRMEGLGMSLVRRAAGGPAIRVGRGQVYVALDLATPEALGGVSDPSRALNRHVRPLLSALTSLGNLAATSGGRDLILVSGEPVAWVGVRHHRRTRRTALEAVISLSKPFGLAPELDLAHGAIAPRWLGKTPTTLDALHGRSVDAREVVQSVVLAYAAMAGGSLARGDLPSLPASRVDAGEPPFVAMVEESIGLLGGAVERERMVVGGDLMASYDVLEELGGELFALGPDASDEALGRTIDGAFGDDALLFGVKSHASIAKLVRATWAATKTNARG